MTFLFVSLAALLGLYMAWNIGANDVANSMADAVGSRALTIKKAVVLAGICEFAGAVLVGSHVTETIRKGIVNPSALTSLPGIEANEAAALMVIGMTAALLAAALWLHFSSWLGMPVSTTHSIVGAVAGFGIAAAGWAAVSWGKMGQIVLSWFISPLVGGTAAFLLFIFISRSILRKEQPAKAATTWAPFIVFLMTLVVTLATIYKGLKHIIKGLPWFTDNLALALSIALAVASGIIAKVLLTRKLRRYHGHSIAEQLEAVEQVFTPLVIISSCSVAFAHGANDVANSVGPLAAVVHVLTHGNIEMKVAVPFWVLALGGGGIVIGLATYGYRVMHMVGTEITEITPSRGVAADIAATATVLACTRLKLPVSTTHTLVGAIIGIGLARGLGGINQVVTKKIVKSWLITVPAAALLCICLFAIGKLLFYDALASVLSSSVSG